MLRILIVAALSCSAPFAVQGASPQSSKQAQSSAATYSPKQIYEHLDDSVVKIVTDKESGTGFFVKNGQMIATCYHVVRGAANIKVEGTNGAKWSVDSIYIDKESDAAILKLSVDSKRRPIPIGDTSKLETGDELSIIGNPLGFLTESLTTGIVSAQRISHSVNLIQTTAAISPGSSGSPVITSEGKVVGFVSFAFTQGQSLNMAVSANSLVHLWAEDSVPLADFLASASLNPSADNAEVPTSSAAKQATIKLATWWGRVALEEAKWSEWWNIECESGGADGTSVMGTALDYAKEFAAAADDTKDFEKTLSGLWNHSETTLFEQTLDDLDAAVADVATTEAKANIASRYQPDKLEDRTDEFHAAWIRLDTLRTRLFEIFHKEPWFDWKLFRDNLSASVLFYSFAPNLDGIMPDPVLDEGCYIGYAKPETGIKAGAKITGIRTKDSTTVDSVTTWRDVADWLTKHPDIDTVVVSYSYLGQDSTTELTPRRAQKAKEGEDDSRRQTEGDTHPKSGG